MMINGENRYILHLEGDLWTYPHCSSRANTGTVQNGHKEQTSVMSTFNVYVGSDNKTHKVDIERIQGVVMRMHQGFTIQRTTGSWHGTVEESAIVVIQDDYELVHRTARILKRELSQESVGFQQVSDIEYI